MSKLLEEIQSEKIKLEDAIYILISEFEKRNIGCTVDEVVVNRAHINPCAGPEVVNLKTRIVLNNIVA